MTNKGKNMGNKTDLTRKKVQQKEQMYAMRIKPYNFKKNRQPYSGNLADTSSIISEIAGSNISHLPLSSVGSISSTEMTSSQLLSRANNRITTRTADISNVFNFGLRPIKDNIEATIPRL